MNELILKNYTEVSVAIAAEAHSQKAAALKSASIIKTVVDELSEELAVDALTDIKRIIKAIEESRKSVKAPVLKTGNEIDDMAKTFIAELLPERDRLEAELTRREKERREARRKEEEARQAEIARLKQQEIDAAKEKQRLADEEKAAQEEANRKLAAANTVQEAQAVVEQHQEKQAEITQQKAEVEKKEIAAVTAQVPAPLAKQKKIAGVSARSRWTFKVINIDLLYQTHPELVNMTERTADINARLAQGDRKIPGLEIFEDLKVG